MQSELVRVTTLGDRESQPIGTLDREGVFTRELQRAVLEGEVDVAVHSLKDLPTEPVQGLLLVGVPERGPIGDVLVTPLGLALEQLASGARIATGSLRRRAQLWHARRDLRMVDVRGNVDTRLRKLRDGEFDALVLAEAGLTRLGHDSAGWHVLPKTVLLPAVGQGALGLEARADDPRTIEQLQKLDHEPTHRAVIAERAMLASLRGGCLAPIAAWGRVEAVRRLCLTGVVLSADGSQRLFAQEAAELPAAADLGRKVAHELLSQGAADLVQAARRSASGDSKSH